MLQVFKKNMVFYNILLYDPIFMFDIDIMKIITESDV